MGLFLVFWCFFPQLHVEASQWLEMKQSQSRKRNTIYFFIPCKHRAASSPLRRSVCIHTGRSAEQQLLARASCVYLHKQMRSIFSIPGFLGVSQSSEVSKRGWREGVGDKQTPKGAPKVLQKFVPLLLRGNRKRVQKRGLGRCERVLRFMGREIQGR